MCASNGAEAAPAPAAAGTAGRGMEKFTLEQVQADPDLMICDGMVLDVRSFKQDHPGGSSYMEAWAGRDITEIFQAPSSHKHTDYARRVLESLQVGTLIGVEVSKEERRKYEGLVDVEKPFLFQIGPLGEQYHGWMASQPVVRKLTIFPWLMVEALSRYPWWWIWVGCPPMVALGLVTAAMAGVDMATSAAFFSLGMATWIFIEYTLHRFVFHLETAGYGSNLFHFFAHGLHHLTPHDTTRLTFPPPFTYLLAVLFWNLFRAVCLGHAGFSSMFAGFVTGYIAYDTTHFLYHHTDGSRYGSIKFPRFFRDYLRFMKSHHNTHHFLNDTCNYGVSSPILDFAFGTYQSKEEAEAERELKAKKAQ